MEKPTKDRKQNAGFTVAWNGPSEREEVRWIRQFDAIPAEELLKFIRRGVEVGAIPSVKRARTGGAICLSVYYDKQDFPKWFQSEDDVIPILAVFDDLYDKIERHALANPDTVGKVAKGLYEGA